MRHVAWFVLLLAACRPSVDTAPVKPRVARAPLASARPLPPARPSRCMADPSTVYGREDVVFRVEGEGEAGATVHVELLDERRRLVTSSEITVPGELRPPDLPSGDFVLIVGSNLTRCAVTVNRELSRATQTVP